MVIDSWVMTEKVQLQKQAFEMKFLRKNKRLTMFDKLHNIAIRETINIELLLLRIERSQL